MLLVGQALLVRITNHGSIVAVGNRSPLWLSGYSTACTCWFILTCLYPHAVSQDEKSPSWQRRSGKSTMNVSFSRGSMCNIRCGCILNMVCARILDLIAKGLSMQKLYYIFPLFMEKYSLTLLAQIEMILCKTLSKFFFFLFSISVDSDKTQEYINEKQPIRKF